MKSSVNIITLLLLLSLVSVSLRSCIDDKLDHCDPEVRIYFDYVPATDEVAHYTHISVHSGIKPENITRLNLFVFDENDTFVAEYIDESPSMSFDYFMTIPGLAPGIYRFVVWGGMNELYSLTEIPVKGQTKMQDLILYLNSIENGTVDKPVTHLFYAAHLQEKVEVKNTQELQKFTLNLVQDTYTINFIVRGTEVEEPYFLSVLDNNSRYYFDNLYAPYEDFSYTFFDGAVFNDEGETVSFSSITILRLTEDHPSYVKLSNPDNEEIVIERELVSLLLSVRDVGGIMDFSYMHEFDIEVNIDNEGTDISMIINGWKLINDGNIGIH